MKIKYKHTNLIARRWKDLADFYQKVFDCTPVLPQRDLAGQAMDAGTGLKSAHIRGMHLGLPGYGETGPTLEIFSYDQMPEGLPPMVNRPGFGHIAFQVEDLRKVRDLVLQSGGGKIGEVVTVEIGGGARVTWCYLTDPEGNIVELQE